PRAYLLDVLHRQITWNPCGRAGRGRAGGGVSATSTVDKSSRLSRPTRRCVTHYQGGTPDVGDTEGEHHVEPAPDRHGIGLCTGRVFGGSGTRRRRGGDRAGRAGRRSQPGRAGIGRG